MDTASEASESSSSWSLGPLDLARVMDARPAGAAPPSASRRVRPTPTDNRSWDKQIASLLVSANDFPYTQREGIIWRAAVACAEELSSTYPEEQSTEDFERRVLTLVLTTRAMCEAGARSCLN